MAASALHAIRHEPEARLVGLRLASLVLALAFFVTQLQPRSAAVAQTGVSAAPAYSQRGDAVEAEFRAYRERLQRFYDALRGTVVQDAPDLLSTPKATAPPRPVPHGYGILPKLIPDAPPPGKPPRARSAWYSWPWTQQLIEGDAHRLDGLQADLDRIATLSAAERHAACEKLLAEYRQLTGSQRTIDAHIQYNRLWQGAIAKDRARYDQQTTLHNAVLERQAVLDALHAPDDAAFRGAVRGITVSDPTKPRGNLEPELRQREQTLARAIHDATDRIMGSPFVRVSHPSAHRWVVQVPVYTDITDAEFVRRFKNAVEHVWRVRDGGDEFGVRLALTRMPVSRLYRHEPTPRRGAPMDVDAHCARFPEDGAVLTTGAASTHVAIGRCIAIGPQDIAPHTLAHEFGHLLGLRDVYFRGYRDLGADGYQVMEVVADPDDIMGAPATGPVLRRHFDKLIGSGLLPSSADGR